MNLNDFTRHIDKTIISRGQNYYREGRVGAIRELEPDCYIATVEGTDSYSVRVKLDENNDILDTDCDCPYTGGPYCKHIAAVLVVLASAKKANGCVVPIQEKQSFKPVPSGRKMQNRLAEQLSEQSKDRLVKLLLMLAEEDEKLRERLLAEVTTGADERDKWVSLMKHSLHEAMDEDGFISYRNCHKAVDGAYRVLQRAQTAVEEENYELAVELALCVMQQMAEMMQFADDSGGDIGLVAEEALSLLSSAAADMPDQGGAGCFRRLLQAASEPCYSGWTDWRIELLNICSLLTRDSWQREQLERFLDDLQADAEAADSWAGKYEAEAVILLRYELMQQFDGPLQAADFLHQHRQFPKLREIAIRQALSAGHFDAAATLALEGEAHDRNWPGLVRQWEKYRFEVYRLSKQQDKLLALGRELAVSGDFTDYQTYKNLCSQGEWPELYPAILEEIAKQPGFISQKYTQILLAEQDWPRLWSYVQKNPRRILDFYRQLLPDYREQVYELFAVIIRQQADKSSNRSQYKEVCSQLRLLVKIGNKSLAAELVQELLLRYPRRPAFREELQKVLP